MKTYTFHHDPGHGWLEVPFADLLKYNLDLCDFSPYSYVDQNNIYLEEDEDAGIFIKAVIESGDAADFKEFNSKTKSKYSEYIFIRELRPNPRGSEAAKAMRHEIMVCVKANGIDVTNELWLGLVFLTESALRDICHKLNIRVENLT